MYAVVNKVETMQIVSILTANELAATLRRPETVSSLSANSNEFVCRPPVAQPTRR